jgi:hypothetical protein
LRIADIAKALYDRGVLYPGCHGPPKNAMDRQVNCSGHDLLGEFQQLDNQNEQEQK